MILGKSKLDKKMQSMSRMNVKKGISKGIQFVQEVAKSNCPVYAGELREKIMAEVEDTEDLVRGICWSAAEHGMYVEFGTGPKGQANHEGISPEESVSYSQNPWWIHESQIDKEIAEHYHFFYIDTPQGRFYQCTGQPAQPFLYPALKNNENEILEMISKEVRKQL